MIDQIKFILLLIISLLFVSFQNNEPIPQIYNPWFTGSFLAPTPITMKPGHPAIEPTVTVFNTYGKYNSHWKIENQTNIWAINPLVDFQIGFTETIGLEVIASCISNFRSGQTATHLQDTVLLLAFQISTDSKDSWVPDCRFDLQGVFPTGKYQKLNPKKFSIDATGQGAFQTGPEIVFRKRFYLPRNFFSLVWSVGYLFPLNVHVKGFNSYGGGIGTRGKVHPGQTLTAFLSGEYSITQKWVFAFDTELLYQRKSFFSGKKGRTLAGQPALVGLPVSLQISIAPEIEYNFNSWSGLLAGAWFTVIGKNANAFASGFIGYVYVF